MSAITLDDFARGAGLLPEDFRHERCVRGLRQIYWPAEMRGGDGSMAAGWWWAIGTIEGAWLAGGWSLGSVRDRNMEIASAIARLTSPEAVYA